MSISSSPKQDQFTELFREFAESYPLTEDGQRHILNYAVGREDGRRNYEELIAATDRGEDITDAVLLKLLPYADSANNREKGAWIHLAPTINGDIRKWYERAGWSQPEEWPQIAQDILAFVRRCADDPAQLDAACQDFDQLPYKGFQAGTLSPILNALHPDQFLIVNNKSREAINYFSDSAISQSIRDYPEANRMGWQTIAALADQLVLDAAPDLSPADTFDMFSHWLSAVKKFAYRSKRSKTARNPGDRPDKTDESVFQIKVPTYDQLMTQSVRWRCYAGGNLRQSHRDDEFYPGTVGGDP
jgi:5-methylcytosine-specific restriction enzyme B